MGGSEGSKVVNAVWLVRLLLSPTLTGCYCVCGVRQPPSIADGGSNNAVDEALPRVTQCEVRDG